MTTTVPDPHDPRGYRYLGLREREEMAAFPDLVLGDEERYRPLSWGAWLEIALLILFASGCSAGFVLGLDRALYGQPRPLICIGATVEHPGAPLTLPLLPRTTP